VRLQGSDAVRLHVSPEQQIPLWAGGSDGNSPIVGVAFSIGILTPDVDTTNRINM
jgi:hypothetical protein